MEKETMPSAMKKGWLWLLRRNRAVSAVAAALAALIVCIIIVGFIPLSNTMLTTAIERLARESLSGDISWKSMTITLWTGITLKSVRYSLHDQSGMSIDCSVGRIAVSYYLLPILLKKVIIKNISLGRPTLRVDFPSQEGPLKPSAGSFSFDAFERVLSTIPYTVLLRAVSIDEGRVIVLKGHREQVDCSGISIAMNVGLKSELQLTGRVEIARLKLMESWLFTSLRTTLRVNETEAVVDNCHALLYGGNLSIKGSVGVRDGALRYGSVGINNVSLDEWYRNAEIGTGRLAGKVDAAMTFQPSALAIDSLRGKGWVTMINVSARNIPLQKNLLVLLIIPKLATMKFTRIYSDLSLNSGRLYNQKCTGHGEPLDFNADGWVSITGAISEDAEGIFSADFVRELPPLVRYSLLPAPDDSNRRSFKCTITGTFKNPKCRVDARIQKRAAGNVIDAIGKGLSKLFGK